MRLKSDDDISAHGQQTPPGLSQTNHRRYHQNSRPSAPLLLRSELLKCLEHPHRARKVEYTLHTEVLFGHLFY
ncbi:uncharacterized protein H6S33_007216 [Morchella sextelata]|uniref:uncharacterized protein n=1 Tax=Morchella sextelata TaxID=1174677 RepID=UPI001D04067E|nr:uncharacterized protein H6S33_007216 [Morchella sextelata]KAH0604185.1 hypothetical protein H6S33_007216 [Morchella sextelata]